MTIQLDHVNQRIRLGNVDIRNRLFIAAHSTNFAERLSNERLRDYYLERARGGVGLIIHEPVIVHPSSLSRPTKVWGFDRENVTNYRQSARAVHDAGAAFFCQVLHNGAHMGSSFISGPLWAPSAVADPLSGETAHEMTEDEITAVIEGFALTSEICQEGGFDGVELHGSHGYLVQQFLSPLTNHRTDDYGGDEARRRRFLLEIIAAVRRRVGRDFVVGVRLAGDERAAGGMTTADAGALVQRLEADGAIDYVNVSTGGSASPGWIVLDATFDRGANVDAAAAVKQATSLPVLVAGRIARPSEAESVLADGVADMVGVARALIADPQWLSKGNAGDEHSIRPCTYCNECVAGIGAYRPIGCTVNPDMGHEREVDRSGWGRSAKTARRVVVVGGGVAGMESALTAAHRGHEVVLFEAGERLGGQLLLAPPTSYRRELVHLPAFLAEAVRGAGVDIKLGVDATERAVLDLDPDAVIVATGSKPQPSADGVSPYATSALALLEGRAGVGRRVLVCHDGGHPWEFDVVLEVLAGKDHDVVAVVPSAALVPRGTDAGLFPRLARAGVQVLTSCSLVDFSDGRAELRNVLTGDRRTEAGFDSLVVALTRQAQRGLVRALRLQVDHVQAVGDGLAPRSVRDAMWEGRAAGRRIGE